MLGAITMARAWKVLVKKHLHLLLGLLLEKKAKENLLVIPRYNFGGIGSSHRPPKRTTLTLSQHTLSRLTSAPATNETCHFPATNPGMGLRVTMSD